MLELVQAFGLERLSVHARKSCSDLACRVSQSEHAVRNRRCEEKRVLVRCRS
jgi:hypothetical protein